MNKLTYFILPLLLLSLGCSQEKKAPFSNSSYISDSEEIEGLCSDAIISFLKPMKIEGVNNIISQLYQLKVELETNLYKKSQANKYLFIGMILNNDKDFKLIFALDTINGYIMQCREHSNGIFIQNLTGFKHNFESFKSKECLNIPSDQTLPYCTKNQINYWQTGFSTGLKGKWAPKTDHWNQFKDERLNDYWYFHGDIDNHMVSFENDTIKKSFYIENGMFEIEEGNISFRMICMLNNTIILYDKGHNLYHYLKKI